MVGGLRLAVVGEDRRDARPLALPPPRTVAHAQLVHAEAVDKLDHRSRSVGAILTVLLLAAQGGEAEVVLGLLYGNQAKPDPSSRFRPTAIQPSALKGPNSVPHRARTTPMP